VSGEPERFDQRFASAESEGRALLTSRESKVSFQDPFLLASRCESQFVDLGLRHITLFAFVVAGIVAILIAVKAAPAPLGLFAAVWITGALLARRWAKRRRAELGRALLDFESDRVSFVPIEGSAKELPLSGTSASKEASNDEEAPIWLVIRLSDGTKIRLCRGEDRDVDRVLVVLRRFHVKVTDGS
jgi:hypothetical protein